MKAEKRSEESCTIWEGIEAHGWVGFRVVWSVWMAGVVKYAWICMCVPVNVRSSRWR